VNHLLPQATTYAGLRISFELILGHMAHISLLFHFIVIVKCRLSLVLRAVLIILIALNHLKISKKELAEIRKKMETEIRA